MILESTSHFFLLSSSNPLYRARRILQYDHFLGWMQKPNLNTTFENQKIHTDSEGFRISDEKINLLTNPKILTLGPSSAFGWGVANKDTYTSVSAKKLNFEHINASGVGHSIAQGQRIWSKIKKVNPKYVLIAYGVNDLDKFRFFDSDSLNDKEFFQHEPHALKIDKLLLPSDSAIVISLVLRQLSHTFYCDQLINSPQRVEWPEYEKILSMMTDEMLKAGIKPIIINTPFFLVHPNPRFKESDILNAYREVNSFAAKGYCKEAHEKLKIAKSLEPFNINQKVIELNRLLKEFANKNNLSIVDAHSLLVNQNAKENFYDPVHPSAKGHKLIADEIVKLIQEKN